MTISKRVQKELYSAAPAGVLPPLAVVSAQQQQQQQQLPSKKRGAARAAPKKSKSERALAAAIALENKGKAWTDDEHARFLEALKTYPSGPWKAIADFVGTKNSRQTMTHAQKYRQKHERRMRGLRNRAKHRKTARATSTAPLPAPPTTENTTLRSNATTRSQTKRRATPHEPLVIPSTPQPGAACAGASESPRSGEESTAVGASVAFLESMAVDTLMDHADAFASGTAAAGDAVYNDAAGWDQLKVSSLSEIFQDFEPMNFLPAMWSTSSLGDIEAFASAATVSYPGAAFGGANELFSDSSVASANPLSLWS